MRLFLLTVGCAVSTSVAYGQGFTLQAPVFYQFSVGTTVSTPDRGSSLLGGTTRAFSGRGSYGVFRPGTATGFTREHRSARTHVYIHDFEAMDRMILGPNFRDVARRGGAWRSPREEFRREISGRELPAAAPVASAESRARRERARKAYLKLAERAEAKGNTTLAGKYRAKALEYASRTASEQTQPSARRQAGSSPR